jgi:hypothetical protein
MKIQIELARPRWLRRPRTWRTRALALLVAARIVAVPVAWASHQFGDVPNTNPHHDDISAIFGARITAGCNPPANTLYCPTTRSGETRWRRSCDEAWGELAQQGRRQG